MTKNPTEQPSSVRHCSKLLLVGVFSEFSSKKLLIVVYQGPNQTNQDSIEAWLKHEEPNSTRQQQEVINQSLAPARLNTACNSKTKGTLNDNSNAGIW